MQGFFSNEKLDGFAMAACHKCGLYKECESPKIPAQGGRSCGRNILFVGDYPNQEADEAGIPIAGERRDWLEGVLRDYDVDLDDCDFTNAAICHSVPKQTVSTWNQIFEYCRPNLLKTIKVCKPKVIIPMGWPALRSLFPDEVSRFGGPLKKWAGWQIPSQRYNAWVCLVDDPKEIGKSKIGETLFRATLKAAIGAEGRPLPKGYAQGQIRGLVDVVLGRDEALARLRNLAKSEGYLAFDYEATGLKLESDDHAIVCCGFYTGKGRPWACMITEDLHEALSAVLRNRDLYKIASNLKYEERATRAILGHGVANWYWDTMLAAHYKDNRGGISSVKFQAFVLMGVPPWDSEIDKYLEAESPNDHNSVKQCPNKKELLIYCALDAYLEFKVMLWQQRGMNITP